MARKFGAIRKCHPSGRFQARYIGPDGLEYKAPQTYQYKDDAEAWLTDRRREIDREVWSPPATSAQKTKKAAAETKFGDYAEHWLKTRVVRGRPLARKTSNDYADLLRLHILPTFGHKNIRDIDEAAVDRWYAKMAPGAPSMRANAYSLLRTIMKTAHEKARLIDTNPCMVAGGGTKKRVSRTKIAEFTELDTIVETIPFEYEAMVLLAAWCTARYSECIELRRKDFNLVKGVVHIERHAVWDEENQKWEVGETKTEAGVRTVDIPPHLIPAFEKKLASIPDDPETRLFPPKSDRPGAWLRQSTFYRHFHRARAAAKRTDLRFHDLRHTCATLAAQNGATIAELMAILGHSTPAAAMRYQHAAQGRGKKIAAAMSAMLEEKSA